jgi:hypothetical protein
MKKIILLVFGLCLLTQNLIAQSNVSDPKTDENAPKLRLSHSPFASLGLIYGGIGYDCRFRVPNAAVDFAVSLSSGVGRFTFLQNQTDETNIPLSASVLFGKGWHSFELGVVGSFNNTTIWDLRNSIQYKNQYISTLGTLGYRLQAPNSGIFLKVYGGIGGGKTNQGEYRKINNSEYILISETPVFKIDAFGRVALGYSF